MGRYKATSSRDLSRKGRREHPVWRGIGCLIIIIVPVLSFATASIVFDWLYNLGRIPNEFLTTPQIPDWLWISPVLAQTYGFLFARFGITAKLMMSVVFILIIGGFFSVFYALMYRAVGPSRYSPVDAPPSRKKTKKYKR